MSVSVGLRASQSKTLAALTAAALSIGRVSLAEIGRRLLGTSAKHGIKRCWRFTANPRVEISAAMAGVIADLFQGRHWRRRPLVVAMSVQARDEDLAVLRAVGVRDFVPKDAAFMSAVGAIIARLRRASTPPAAPSSGHAI